MLGAMNTTKAPIQNNHPAASNRDLDNAF